MTTDERKILHDTHAATQVISGQLESYHEAVMLIARRVKDVEDTQKDCPARMAVLSNHFSTGARSNWIAAAGIVVAFLSLLVAVIAAGII